MLRTIMETLHYPTLNCFFFVILQKETQKSRQNIKLGNHKEKTLTLLAI